MNQYIATSPVTLHAGVVRLTKGQLRGREHRLEPVGKDRYRITAPNQFKRGEEFGYEGELPKDMAGNLTAAKAARTDSRSAREAEKVRARLEADAEAEWKANALLREHHGNDFAVYMAVVLEQMG